MKKFLEINLRQVSWAWLVLLLVSGTVEAQTNDNSTNPSGHKRYHVNITLRDGQKVKGVLKLIGNDRIQVLERKIIGKARTGVDKVPDTLHYSRIQTIKIRNIGAAIGGFLGGTVIGVIVGGLIGYLVPNADTYDYDDDFRILTGFLGAGIGGVAGGIGGAKLGSRSFEINGYYDNFQDFRARMKKKGMEVE